MPLPALTRLQEDPYVTRAIELGRATETRLPGEQLIPQVQNPRESWEVKFLVWGLERFYHFDTRRALHARFGESTFGNTWETATMERYGHAHPRDRDEFEVAHPRLNLRRRATDFARWIVRQDLEHVKADLIEDTASYDPANVITLAGATEWDTAGGDPQGDISAAAALITASTGVQRPDLTIFLSNSSSVAALASPAWRTVTDQLTDAFPDLARLASYLGVKRVWTANPQQYAPATDDLADLYTDFALVYIEADDPRIIAQFDGSWGNNFRWAVDWTRRGGFAGQRYEEKGRTTEFWPWEQFSLPAVINGGAAVLIRNVSAAV